MGVTLPGLSPVSFLHKVQLPIINCIVQCKFLVPEHCIAQVFYSVSNNMLITYLNASASGNFMILGFNLFPN